MDCNVQRTQETRRPKRPILLRQWGIRSYQSLIKSSKATPSTITSIFSRPAVIPTPASSDRSIPSRNESEEEDCNDEDDDDDEQDDPSDQGHLEISFWKIWLSIKS